MTHETRHVPSSSQGSAESPFRRALMDAAFGSLGLGAGYGAGLLASRVLAPMTPRVVLHNKAIPAALGLGTMGAAVLARRAHAEREAWRQSNDPLVMSSSSRGEEGVR